VLRGGLTLTVDCDAPFRTGNGRSMLTLSIAAGRFRTTIAVVNTFRVIIDETAVEVFGSATPRASSGRRRIRRRRRSGRACST